MKPCVIREIEASNSWISLCSARLLANLTPEERELFNALRDNRFCERLRLEQELLGFHWVERVLQQIVSES